MKCITILKTKITNIERQPNVIGHKYIYIYKFIYNNKFIQYPFSIYIITHFYNLERSKLINNYQVIINNQIYSLNLFLLTSQHRRHKGVSNALISKGK